MSRIDDIVVAKNKIGITGHVRPDGDCVGSCLALYNYLKLNYPQIDVDVYLETFSDKFMFLSGSKDIKFNCLEEKQHDLFIVLDTSDLKRIGAAIKYFEGAKSTLSIDHHISNENFAIENIVTPQASSTSEVLYNLLNEEKINKSIAECLYTGIIFDSGVFKYSNTSEATMIIAGKLISYDFSFSKIIDESFYQRTYPQSLITGLALMESKLVLEDKCIYTVVTKEQMRTFGVSSKELDGIVDQLRVIKGIECAIFIYEVENQEYKISLRSNYYVDVNKVANVFDGGGHIKASGCTIKGNIDEIIKLLLDTIKKQI